VQLLGIGVVATFLQKQRIAEIFKKNKLQTEWRATQ
jgi:hypothetical protein